MQVRIPPWIPNRTKRYLDTREAGSISGDPRSVLGEGKHRDTMFCLFLGE